MVEFSMVLMAKQKFDWDSKGNEGNAKGSMLKAKEAFKQSKRSFSTDMKDERIEKSRISGDGMNGESLMLDQFLDYLTPSQNMPPYRKTDIIVFIVFSVFYFCFNLIYFVVCAYS